MHILFQEESRLSLSLYREPRTSARPTSPYQFMHYEDIVAHSRPFYNGHFLIIPWRDCQPSPWLSPEVYDPAVKTNGDVASLALYECATRKETNNIESLGSYQYQIEYAAALVLHPAYKWEYIEANWDASWVPETRKQVQFWKAYCAPPESVNTD